MNCDDSLISELAKDPNLRPVVRMFLDDLPATLERLSNVIYRQDHAEIQRLAHELKGTSASFGYPEISHWADKIERCAQQAASSQTLVTMSEYLDKIKSLRQQAERGWSAMEHDTPPRQPST
jgi:HPt (histidine-containing phosphotransfer) domain-containing protein